MELEYKQFDKKLAEVLPAVPTAQQVATGFGFTEGPLWAGDYLIFSDIPRNRIVRLDMLSDGPEVTTYRRPSGGSNGLTYDDIHRLVACEGTARRMTRTEIDGTVTVLADRYEGKKLNAPNDVVVRSDGTVYFTDPLFGEPNSPKELDFNGVYSISPQGELTLLVDDFILPNGLAFSPDEKILYVNDTAANAIRAYDVHTNGSLTNERIFIEMKGDEYGGADGMKVDTQGNVYCTGPGGFWIIDPEGKPLGSVTLPELPSNMCWGDHDNKTLYLTARTSVFRMRFPIPGIPAYKIDPYPWTY